MIFFGEITQKPTAAKALIVSFFILVLLVWHGRFAVLAEAGESRSGAEVSVTFRKVIFQSKGIMGTRKEQHDSMEKELADMHMDNLWTLLKKLDPQAQRVGQASTMSGMRILILSKEFPEFYESYSASGFSGIQRKPGT